MMALLSSLHPRARVGAGHGVPAPARRHVAGAGNRGGVS